MDSHPDVAVTGEQGVPGSRPRLSDQDLPAADETISGCLFGLDRIERVEIPTWHTERWIATRIGATAAVSLPVTGDITIWVHDDVPIGALPNELASALVRRLLESAAAGEYPVGADEQERIRAMLIAPGTRLDIDGDCMLVGAGPAGETVSLPPAFEAWWQAVKESWIRASAIKIWMLLGLPPGGQLVVGWPGNAG